MRRRLALISTGVSLAPILDGLVREMAPEVETLNIVDDGIVPAIAAAGNTLTPAVLRRVLAYVMAAEQAQADVVLITCSSISEAVDHVRPLVSVPVLKIDEPMARMAAAKGSRIGVVATLETTLAPTTRLIARVAAEEGKEVRVAARLCEGAFEALARGEGETHDRIVRQAIGQLADAVDVVVLAQASMARAADGITDLKVPLLMSPRTGVEAAIARLKSL